ncbi:hypothetical protein QE250_15730 [Chromatiaceae bacterium AAb-1]|nr:hypothetical protein [Chromatiaceae bacterium AAb-1]
MNVRLTPKQKDMLIKVKKRFKWGKKLDFEEQVTSIILKGLEEYDAIDLRELCSDYLLEVGFDESYVVNEEGRTLEELIDILYVE